MTTLAAPTGNEIQNTLAATYERGVDTDITLTDGADFPNSAHVIRISESSTKWCLIIYTTKATHVLTMGGGADDYALANNYVTDGTAVFAIGSDVEVVCAADEIAQLFTEQADKIDEDGSVPLTSDWDIGDGLAIKGDEIRARDGAGLKLFEDGGTKGLFVSDAGIISQAMQSSACAYPTTEAQTFPTAFLAKVIYDAESWDTQTEMDTTRKAGTDDGAHGTANWLEDSSDPFTAADVGSSVWNETDDTYTTVTGFVDAGTLLLAADLFVNGENYRVYRSRFTVTEDGIYLITVLGVLVSMSDGKTGTIRVQVDGLTVCAHRQSLGAAGTFYCTMATTQKISANSYIEVWMQHDEGSGLDNATGVNNNNLVITKIA